MHSSRLLIAAGLVSSGCIFGAQTAEISEDSGATNNLNNATNNAVGYDDANIEWDDCEGIARDVVSVPPVTEDAFALRESSKYDITPIGDSNSTLVYWVNTLSGAGGKRAYVQAQALNFAEANKFSQPMRAQFNLSESEEILLIGTFQVRPGDTGLSFDTFVATNENLHVCQFPPPAQGEPCVVENSLKDLATANRVWPSSRMFVGVGNPFSRDAQQSFLGVEGGNPMDYVAVRYVSGTFQPLPVMGARTNSFSPSYATFLWGFETTNLLAPVLAGVVEQLDDEGVPYAAFMSLRGGNYVFESERAVEIPESVEMGPAKVALGSSYTLEQAGLTAPRGEVRFEGYVAVDEDGDLLMANTRQGGPWVFSAEEPASKVFAMRDLSFAQGSTDVDMPVLFIWGGSKLAAGRVDFNGRGRFADHILGVNVDEVLNVTARDAFLGQAVVAAQVRRGEVVDLRLTRLDLSDTTDSYCLTPE